MEKFSNTLTDISATMLKISTETQRNSNAIVSLTDKVNNINNNVSVLEDKTTGVVSKVCKLDDKTKIDLAVVFREWVLKLLLGGSMFAGIGALLKYTIS